jgi:hypothetical protein
MVMEPEQKERIVKVFNRKKLIQWSMMAVAIAALIVFLKIKAGSGGAESRDYIIFVAVMLGIGVLSFINWRCPACKKYLGNSWAPRECPRCKAKFFREK